MTVPSAMDEKATRILARSLFKELRVSGYSANHILGLSTELIELVTQDLRDAHETASRDHAAPTPEVAPAASA